MTECARCGVSWEDHDAPCSMNLELQEANRTIDRLTKELAEARALLNPSNAAWARITRERDEARAALMNLLQKEGKIP